MNRSFGSLMCRLMPTRSEIDKNRKWVYSPDLPQGMAEDFHYCAFIQQQQLLQKLMTHKFRIHLNDEKCGQDESTTLLRLDNHVPCTLSMHSIIFLPE